MLTKSIVPVIMWHTLYDFINWIALVKGTAEVILITIQSIIMVIYAYYLWIKLPDKLDGTITCLDTPLPLGMGSGKSPIKARYSSIRYERGIVQMNKSVNSIIIYFLVMLVVLSSAYPCSSQQRDVEGTSRVWLNVYYPADLVDTGKWEYVNANVDAVSLFIDYLSETDVDAIREFGDMLDRTGIKLSVECAGICDWYADEYVAGIDSLGRLSAESEIRRVKRLKKAGKNVDYVVFDHPLTRAIYPNEDYSLPARMTYAQAAEQLTHAMVCWKKEYPDIKFIYCVNFPNHGWKGGLAYYKLVDEYGRGDFYEEFQVVLSAAEKAGVKFYALLTDNPYDYATGKRYSTQEKLIAGIDWMARLLDLEKEVKSRGLAFALCFNSETPGTKGPEGEYYRQTISYINDYTIRGGRPDINLIESWYKYPLESVPESEKYSVTYIVKDVIKQIKFGQKADLSSIDWSSKNPFVNTTYADNWQFEGKVDGWIDQSDIEEMRSVDGALYINCNGNDPYILSPDRLNIDAKSYKKLHIRIKNMTRSTSLRVFFITNADSNMDERKSYVAPLTSGDSGYTDVYIDLASNSLWKGTITRLRIDPGDQPGDVYIDFISLE